MAAWIVIVVGMTSGRRWLSSKAFMSVHNNGNELVVDREVPSKVSLSFDIGDASVVSCRSQVAAWSAPPVFRQRNQL